MSIIKYDPDEHTLHVCTMCGVVSEKGVIKCYTRNEDDAKVAYLQCPVCHHEVKVDYHY